jgi:hypothetical protein
MEDYRQQLLGSVARSGVVSAATNWLVSRHNENRAIITYCGSTGTITGSLEWRDGGWTMDYQTGVFLLA